MKDVPPALARDEVITDELLSDNDADFVVHSKPKLAAKPRQNQNQKPSLCQNKSIMERISLGQN